MWLQCILHSNGRRQTVSTNHKTSRGDGKVLGACRCSWQSGSPRLYRDGNVSGEGDTEKSNCP